MDVCVCVFGSVRSVTLFPFVFVATTALQRTVSFLTRCFARYGSSVRASTRFNFLYNIHQSNKLPNSSINSMHASSFTSPSSVLPHFVVHHEFIPFLIKISWEYNMYTFINLQGMRLSSNSPINTSRTICRHNLMMTTPAQSITTA